MAGEYYSLSMFIPTLHTMAIHHVFRKTLGTPLGSDYNLLRRQDCSGCEFHFLSLPVLPGVKYEKCPERVGCGRNRKCAEAFVKAKGAKGDVGD